MQLIGGRTQTQIGSMRVFCAAAVFACATAGAASAADFTSLDAPPVFTWSGFYGGETGGYTFLDKTAKRPDGFWSAAMNAAGSAFSVANGGSQPHNVFGGGQVGFNYQVANLVFGIEGDLSYTGLDTVDGLAGSSSGGSLAFTSDVSSHWLSTMRGRVGTAFDRLLIYTTGGVAVAQRNFTNGYVFQSPDGQDFSIGSASQTAAGLAIGAGLEYALTKNWTLKGEYLYANLGAGKSSFGDSGIPGTSYHQNDLDEKVVRAAINYKFDWLAGTGN
jgi:outer membrane immunogenic protein